jgi:hypothetical protein
MATCSQHQWVSFLRPNSRALSLISSGDGGLTIFDGNTMYERFMQKKNKIRWLKELIKGAFQKTRGSNLSKHSRTDDYVHERAR